MTVSTLSAMRSRDCKLKLMPSVPILMASLTPIVLNLKPTIPACEAQHITSQDRLQIHL